MGNDQDPALGNADQFVADAMNDLSSVEGGIESQQTGPPPVAPPPSDPMMEPAPGQQGDNLFGTAPAEGQPQPQPEAAPAQVAAPDGASGEEQEIPVDEALLSYFGLETPQQLEAAVLAGRDSLVSQQQAEARWSQVQEAERELSQREEAFRQRFFENPWLAAHQVNVARAQNGFHSVTPPGDILAHYGVGVAPQVQPSAEDDLESIFGSPQPPQGPPQAQFQSAHVPQPPQAYGHPPGAPGAPGTPLTMEGAKQIFQELFQEQRQHATNLNLNYQRGQMVSHAIDSEISGAPGIKHLTSYLRSAVDGELKQHADRGTGPDMARSDPSEYYQFVSGVVRKHAAQMAQGLAAAGSGIVNRQAEVQQQFPAGTPQGGYTPTPTRHAPVGPTPTTPMSEGDKSIGQFMSEAMETVDAAFKPRQGGQLPAM